MIEAAAEAHLYERTAARIAGMVERGVFRPGERLPSVRRLSGQLDVSIATAVAAYRLLERQGVVETHPKSGHYVRTTLPCRCPEPARSTPPRGAAPPSTGELIREFIRAASDRSLVPLGAAIPNPDLLPVEALRRAIARAARRHARRSLAYDFAPGCRELRLQLARRAEAAGAEVGPDDLVLTTGCMEAIHLCLRAATKPGDTVAIESPTFYGHAQALEALSLRALEIASCPRDGLDVVALRAALDRRKVAAVIVSPSFANPIGSRMPDERKEELVELCTARGISLIEDDVYGDLAFDGERPRLAKSWDRKGLVLLCSSLSKTLAPGHRVGWVAGGRFAPQVERLKLMTSFGNAALPSLALADFLADGSYERHLRRIRPALARAVASLAQDVARTFPEGTRATRPEGGFVVWLELPGGTCALELHRRALEEGISIAPGPMFAASPASHRSCLRLNAAFWSPQVSKALAKLGRLARELAPGATAR